MDIIPSGPLPRKRPHQNDPEASPARAGYAGVHCSETKLGLSLMYED